MAEIIGIYDGGIEEYRGNNVGVLIFKITNNESNPEEMVGYCHPDFRDSIIKNLNMLNFQKANDLLLDENDDRLHNYLRTGQ